jgi:hypothetical protein
MNVTEAKSDGGGYGGGGDRRGGGGGDRGENNWYKVTRIIKYCQ